MTPGLPRQSGNRPGARARLCEPASVETICSCKQHVTNTTNGPDSLRPDLAAQVGQMNFDRAKIHRITQGLEPFRKVSLGHYGPGFATELQQEPEFSGREIEGFPRESCHIALGLDLQLADRPDFGSLSR